MANMYYWFHTIEGQGPPKGAYILDDAVVEIDFSNRADMDKIKSTPGDKIIGTALQSRQSGEWYGEFPGPRGFAIYLSTEPQPTLEAFAAYLRKRRAEAYSEEESIQADPVAFLERELRSHDWYYHQSDDHSVWSGGEAHWRKIAGLMKNLPIEQAREMFSKYAPEGFSPPV